MAIKHKNRLNWLNRLPQRISAALSLAVSANETTGHIISRDLKEAVHAYAKRLAITAIFAIAIGTAMASAAATLAVGGWLPVLAIVGGTLVINGLYNLIQAYGKNRLVNFKKPMQLAAKNYLPTLIASGLALLSVGIVLGLGTLTPVAIGLITLGAMASLTGILFVRKQFQFSKSITATEEASEVIETVIITEDIVETEQLPPLEQPVVINHLDPTNFYRNAAPEMLKIIEQLESQMDTDNSGEQSNILHHPTTQSTVFHGSPPISSIDGIPTDNGDFEYDPEESEDELDGDSYWLENPYS